jgi:hypothetical protein
MDTNPSGREKDAIVSRRLADSFRTVLLRWLAVFREMYRQPTSDLSIACYEELLSDLSAAELDAACRQAMKGSDFMPTVATIRKALHQLQEIDPPSTFIRYPEVSARDRILSEEEEAQIANVKKRIGLVANRKTETAEPPNRRPKAIYTPRSTPKPIEEQKAELRRRGLID